MWNPQLRGFAEIPVLSWSEILVPANEEAPSYDFQEKHRPQKIREAANHLTIESL
jgi:hypothetical protein